MRLTPSCHAPHPGHAQRGAAGLFQEYRGLKIAKAGETVRVKTLYGCSCYPTERDVEEELGWAELGWALDRRGSDMQRRETEVSKARGRPRDERGQRKDTVG